MLFLSKVSSKYTVGSRVMAYWQEKTDNVYAATVVQADGRG